MNPVIDTLRFSHKLQEGGFTSGQANVLAWALGDELSEQLATKEDIEVQNAEIKVLKEDVAVLKEDVRVLKEDVAALKAEVKALNAKFNYTMALIGLLIALELVPVAGMILG